MNYNISEMQARALLRNEEQSKWIWMDLYPLYHRIGEVFPHLKAEYSYLDWDKFDVNGKPEFEGGGEMKPFCWITSEGIGSLQVGGDAKGVAPVHVKESRVANIPLYTGEQLEQATQRIAELESALGETFEQVYDNPHIDALVERVLADK